MNWLTLQNNLIHVSESNLCRNADNECKNVQFASAIDITNPPVYLHGILTPKQHNLDKRYYLNVF